MKKPDIKKQQEVVQMEMYNHSGKAQLLDPFDTANAKHTGIIHYTDNENLSGNEEVNLIRLQLQCNLLKFASSDTKLFGKKINLLQFFSPNYFQTSIIDIPIKGKLKDINFEKIIEHRDWCIVTYFLGSDKMTLPRTTKETLEQPTMWCFLSNISRHTVQLNLIDYFKGYESNDVYPEIKNLSHNLIVDEDKSFVNFKLLKIATSNTNESVKQIAVVNEKTEETTVITPHISHNSFQGWITETDINLTINKEIKLITSIPPNTKMMFQLL